MNKLHGTFTITSLKLVRIRTVGTTGTKDFLLKLEFYIFEGNFGYSLNWCKYAKENIGSI